MVPESGWGQTAGCDTLPQALHHGSAARAEDRRGAMENRDRIYGGGAWVTSTGTETIDVVDPTTEEVVGRIPQGTPQDVDGAVAAAKEAFSEWSETTADDRAKYLLRIAEGLQARMEPLAKVITE